MCVCVCVKVSPKVVEIALVFCHALFFVISSTWCPGLPPELRVPRGVFFASSTTTVHVLEFFVNAFDSKFQSSIKSIFSSELKR